MHGTRAAPTAVHGRARPHCVGASQRRDPDQPRPGRLGRLAGGRQGRGLAGRPATRAAGADLRDGAQADRLPGGDDLGRGSRPVRRAAADRARDAVQARRRSPARLPRLAALGSPRRLAQGRARPAGRLPRRLTGPVLAARREGPRPPRAGPRPGAARLCARPRPAGGPGSRASSDRPLRARARARHRDRCVDASTALPRWTGRVTGRGHLWRAGPAHLSVRVNLPPRRG